MFISPVHRYIPSAHLGWICIPVSCPCPWWRAPSERVAGLILGARGFSASASVFSMDVIQQLHTVQAMYTLSPSGRSRYYIPPKNPAGCFSARSDWLRADARWKVTGLANNILYWEPCSIATLERAIRCTWQSHAFLGSWQDEMHHWNHKESIWPWCVSLEANISLNSFHISGRQLVWRCCVCPSPRQPESNVHFLPLISVWLQFQSVFVK